MSIHQIISKVWSFCNTLRDEGICRWRKFSYEDIVARDKTLLEITWLKDESFADPDNPY